MLVNIYWRHIEDGNISLLSIVSPSSLMTLLLILLRLYQVLYHKIYLPYFQSMYRLRVGDFLTQRVAQQEADKLKRRGFDTLVVKTRIDPRRAPDALSTSNTASALSA